MSTKPDTRQIPDNILQAAMDAACEEITIPNGYQAMDLRAIYNNWGEEAPARLALARGFLARLPEPTPPVVDGKTPGEVFNEAIRRLVPGRFTEWSLIPEADRANENKAMQAVLAAFGQPSLGAAIARMEAVPWFGSCNCFNQVRARLIAAARDGQGEAACAGLIAEHTPFTSEWWASRWRTEADARNAQFKELRDWKARAEKAEAELARVIADFYFTKLPQLRLIAEAGDVPEGCVRVYGQANGTFLFNKCQTPQDTHFADIRLPSPAASQDSQPADAVLREELGLATAWPAVGDTVRLKSGGPVMTVETVVSGVVFCQWHNSRGEPMSQAYQITSLKPAAKEEQP